MWRNRSRPGFRWPGPSLRVKLVAVLLCLLAAGAAVIVTVGASALRGQLVRQAGAQLRAYANQLGSHSFQVLGTAQGAPVGAVPFAAHGTAAGARTPGTAGTIGSPGAVRMAGESDVSGAAISAGAPSAVVAGIAGIGAFSIELRGPSGQLLLSAGPGTRPGLPLPRPFSRVPRRTGVLLTVPGVGGSYLVIAEPVRYLARRLVYGYGADDFAVTSGGRDGTDGTLVVGLRTDGIGQAIGRLTRLGLAVSAAVILIAGGLAWAAIRFSLRPVTRAAQTADAVAASDRPGGMPDGVPEGVLDRGEDGRAGWLDSMLSQLDARFTASADAEAVARSATDQMAHDLESLAAALRRPVSLLHGMADSWPHHRRRGTGEADPALDHLTAAAARVEALLDEADSALFTDPARAKPDKTPSSRTGSVKSGPAA